MAKKEDHVSAVAINIGGYNNNIVGSAPAPVWEEHTAMLDDDVAFSKDKHAWKHATNTLLAAISRDAGGVGAAELWTRPYDEQSNANLLHLTARWSSKPADDAALVGTKTPDPAPPGVGYAAVLMEDDDGKAIINFRELDSLANNPELPPDERIEKLMPRYERVAGLTLASNVGVIVLFVEKSNDPDDVDRPVAPCARASAMPFLRASAAAVSALVQTRLPRHMYLAQRTNKAARSWRSLRSIVRSGLLKQPKDLAHVPQKASRLKAYASKFKGAAKGTPPKMIKLEQAAHIFIGVFITLILLSGGNKLISEETSGEYGLLLGSMGALCTLLFAAPNSPLAQPRNVLYGHLMACLVGIVLNYMTETANDKGDGIPRWVTQALSPSLAIAGMALFGVTHPPAGAVSLIMVSAKPMIDAKWRAVGAPVFAMITISVIVASMYNNAHPKKQYPTAWLLQPTFTR
ncbi:transmembrane protein [Pycnococcus provasolii]